MSDTKIALIVRHDLAMWQKLNVVAFLATGIASETPEAIGETYIDSNHQHYGKILGSVWVQIQTALNNRYDLQSYISS